MARKSPQPAEPSETKGRRNYLSQSDVPAYSVDDALRVATAIADNYGKSPTKPLRVAQAMNMQPQSSTFRMLCGAAIAYGLTDGGYNSTAIAITPLGRRIVAPTREGDDVLARREALLRPRVVRDFLTRYNGSKVPSEQIAKNVLEELGVPQDRAGQVYQLIVDSARACGLVQDVKGQAYVDLDDMQPFSRDSEGSANLQEDATAASDTAATEPETAVEEPRPTTIKRNARVFITHGKNREIVSQLKDLLTFGGFTPVVAIEQETISKPVPDKVMDDMRSCAAAIIHVGTERKLLDRVGAEHRMLNENVLIEIGAAMALYGRKFILLVENGTELPSNLQGLYEVRYEGQTLDYGSTMKLLKAFNDFRS